MKHRPVVFLEENPLWVPILKAKERLEFSKSIYQRFLLLKSRTDSTFKLLFQCNKKVMVTLTLQWNSVCTPCWLILWNEEDFLRRSIGKKGKEWRWSLSRNSWSTEFGEIHHWCILCSIIPGPFATDTLSVAVEEQHDFPWHYVLRDIHYIH